MKTPRCKFVFINPEKLTEVIERSWRPKECETIDAHLVKFGFSAAAYHAGITDDRFQESKEIEIKALMEILCFCEYEVVVKNSVTLIREVFQPPNKNACVEHNSNSEFDMTCVFAEGECYQFIVIGMTAAVDPPDGPERRDADLDQHREATDDSYGHGPVKAPARARGPQWPERKLQRKKGNLEEDKIKADSTEGKNKRVWAPVFAFCQAAFQRESISDRNTLFLCRPRGMPAGASDARILAEIPPATCNDEGGRRAARREDVGENEGRVSRRGFEQSANGQRKRTLGGFQGCNYTFPVDGRSPNRAVV
ncbi:hypothetical protein DAPPUDRAFT_253665 [Daphnia pulex]|uniref:Uncharacterized protein n=1 Tax=Daphnia pulex TaxID=6669 RepID=E9H5B6_DAPPU|nr:hypothetical protein DAPPUDRAFT_253665 [Daphnia pulex]|eukprot:EFX73104.1 hypothetical protein DAPPUDRAFT_253665 [Daphnia pulex]